MKKRSIAIVIGVGFAVCALPVAGLLALQRMSDVAAVQNSLGRAWEIQFGPEPRPRMMPWIVDEAAQGVLGKLFGGTRGTTNRDLIYVDRFRSLFCGPIREVDIYESRHLQGDLGAVLQRFPSLRRFSLAGNVDTPTEAEWMVLCGRIRLLPDLEELVIDGNQVSDAAIAPLAGHPGLRKVAITSAVLTPDGVKTLATLPRLSELSIEKWGGYSPQEKKAIMDALPRVKIEFPN